jgi:putative hydrolase of the HAD superfamily
VKYGAVIFDLFGTLVDIYARAEYGRSLQEMAAALAVPPDVFNRAWVAAGDARTLGKVDSPRGSLRQVCAGLGIAPTSSQLDRACAARLGYFARNMRPAPGAAAALARLGESGYHLGLISNCTTEPVELWRQSPFARLIHAPVFSCLVGLKKPDSRIYAVAVERAGVPAGQCLYVADGDGGELQGALDAGMDAVRIRLPEEAAGEGLRIKEEEWRGKTLSNFEEVLALMGIKP